MLEVLPVPPIKKRKRYKEGFFRGIAREESYQVTEKILYSFSLSQVSKIIHHEKLP